MAKQQQKTQLQPLLLSIPEVASSLKLSRAKVYMLIDVEGLPVVRFGRAVRVIGSLIATLGRTSRKGGLNAPVSIAEPRQEVYQRPGES